MDMKFIDRLIDDLKDWYYKKTGKCLCGGYIQHVRYGEDGYHVFCRNCWKTYAED